MSVVQASSADIVGTKIGPSGRSVADGGDCGSTCFNGEVTSKSAEPQSSYYGLRDAPGYAARRLYQSYTALWWSSVDARVTGPQFAVMTAVRAQPGLDQRSLAGIVSLDTSTMADVCRRLEDRGQILREADPEDARRKVLRLTADGEQLLDEVTARSVQLNERLLETIPVSRRAELLADLFALSEHWEALADHIVAQPADARSRQSVRPSSPATN